MLATVASMTTRKAKIHGPTTRTVASNVRRLRERAGLSVPQLSGKTGELGYRIPPEAIHKIEAARDARPGARHINVDEVTVLAVALGVSPLALLLPPTVRGDTEVTGAGKLPARDAWRWARGRERLKRDRADSQGLGIYVSHGDDEDVAIDAIDREKDMQFKWENAPDDPPVSLPANMTREQMEAAIAVEDAVVAAEELGLSPKATTNRARSVALSRRSQRLAQQKEETRRAQMSQEERDKEDAQRAADRQAGKDAAQQIIREMYGNREEPPSGPST